MYSPFGSLSFSHSMSSTKSQSSMSTTTTTTQQHHQVTERSHWSSGAPTPPRMSAGDLRERMANSFANRAGFLPLDNCPKEACSDSTEPKLDKTRVGGPVFNLVFVNGGNDCETMPQHPEPRAIKKVFMHAQQAAASAPCQENYQDRLCGSLRDNMRIQENRSPSSAVESSSSAMSTRSNSPRVVTTPKRTTSGGQRSCNQSSGSRARRGKELPLRSRNIDMRAFYEQASSRDLFLNPADRMAGHREPAPNMPSPSRTTTSPRQNFCSFCKNNGEDAQVYMSHPLKDSLGKNACPVLRNYECPKCHASGDYAHTNKYCPQTQRRQKESKIRQHLNNNRA